MSLILELLGLACLTVAGFTVTTGLGFTVAGAGLLIIGQAVDGAQPIRAAKLRWARRQVARRRREAES